ncbi:MAG: hypothetical protein ABIM88_03480 [candidate division WOR-3 bacterium]
MLGIFVIVLSSQKDTLIDLGEAQRRAGAIMAAAAFGKTKGGIYADASAELEPIAARLSSLGKHDGKGGFTFTDPDSAEKAALYVKGVEATTGVNRCFSILSKQIVIYRAPIQEAYRPETEVKIGTATQLWVENPEEYRYFKTLADAYGIKWGVDEKRVRRGGKPLPGDMVEKCKLVMELWDAYSKIETTNDTSMVMVYKKDIKSKAEVNFSKSAELFKGFLLSDSVFQIYNIYAEESPMKAKIGAEITDLRGRVDFFTRYLTEGSYLFQEARRELVTGPDGTQAIKETPEKRGTRWDFIKWFLPDLVDVTQRTLRAFGKTLK